MIPTLRKLNWIASQQFGIDIRRLIKSPIGLIRYFRDLSTFSQTNRVPLRLQPCLHDWWEQAGAIESEYFWQDLFVARLIHQRRPDRHIDIGSRLDGFVAHLACFMDVEVFDVRKLDLQIPGVTFRQADMMDPSRLPKAYASSVSCLHAIEHFGLGRYGDPIKNDGFELGLTSLSKILLPSGSLYLSCPVGKNLVHFNAHRTLHPSFVEVEAKKTKLELKKWWIFNAITKNIEEQNQQASLYSAKKGDTLAIYEFTRLNE